jgi:hypothetical protein
VAGNPELIPRIAEATGAEGHPDYQPDLDAAVAAKLASAAARAEKRGRGLLPVVS